MKRTVFIVILFMLMTSLVVPSDALTECGVEQVQGEYDFAVDYLNKMYENMYTESTHDLTADTVWFLTKEQKQGLQSKISDMDLEFIEGMLPYPLEHIIGDIDIPYLGDAAMYGRSLGQAYPSHITEKIKYYKYQQSKNGVDPSYAKLGEVAHVGARIAENGIVFFNFAFDQSTEQYKSYRYFDISVCEMDGKYIVLCVLEGGGRELPMPFDMESWKAGKIAVDGVTFDPTETEQESETETESTTNSVAEPEAGAEANVDGDDNGNDTDVTGFDLVPWTVTVIAVTISVVEGIMLFRRKKS